MTPFFGNNFVQKRVRLGLQKVAQKANFHPIWSRWHEINIGVKYSRPIPSQNMCFIQFYRSVQHFSYRKWDVREVLLKGKEGSVRLTS